MIPILTYPNVIAIVQPQPSSPSPVPPCRVRHTRRTRHARYPRRDNCCHRRHSHHRVMSTPPPSKSPPRRARPIPQIPPYLLSPTFSAASHALNLIDYPQSSRINTLSSLRTLCDQISSSLHATAPSWDSLTPAIAALRQSLHTTQSASALRLSLAGLHHLPSRDPPRMAAVVHRAAQLSANVALASAVRDFAHLLHLAGVPDSFHSHPHDPSSTYPSQSQSSPTSLPDRFLSRATALHRARLAASFPPLSAVPALDDARAALSRHHSALQSNLEAAIVSSIYAPHSPAPSTDDLDVNLPPSPPTSPPLPSSPVAPDAFPALVSALDLLGGPAHAASVLRAAAPQRLIALVRDALHPRNTSGTSNSFSHPNPSPVPTTKMNPVSPSTLPSPLPTSQTISPMSHPFKNQSSIRSTLHNVPQSTSLPYSAHVFDPHLSQANRAACAQVFERIRLSMTAVLRRLSALLDAVPDDSHAICPAIHAIWREMEATLVTFVHTLLAFPTSPSLDTLSTPSNVSVSSTSHDSPHNHEAPISPSSPTTPTAISLLPSMAATPSTTLPNSFTAAWHHDRRNQTATDPFSALVHSVPTLTPTIYNLEVAHGPLQQLIMSSSRMQDSWKDRSTSSSDVDRSSQDSCIQHRASNTAPSQPHHEPALPSLLARAVDLFVRTVRRDVNKYMRAALGNRAGALLQPVSLQARLGRANTVTSTTLGKSMDGVASTTDVISSSRAHHIHQHQPASTQTPLASHMLPPLPQTRLLIDVIASCLSLAAAVPSVAARIGDVLNQYVILPFCDRAAYALDLAASWSDAGVLLKTMTNSILEEGISNAQEVEQNGMVHTSFDSDIYRGSSSRGHKKEESCPNNSSKDSTQSKGHILRQLRADPGITTRCLSQLCERRKVWGPSVTLLSENEWNAVVRLVSNAKIIISELESCVGKAVERVSTSDYVSASIGARSRLGDLSVGMDESFQIASLRGVLKERGVSSRLQGPVVEAITRTQNGCRRLREEVIERGVVLLHCEVVLHCFSRVIETLGTETNCNGSVRDDAETDQEVKKSRRNISRDLDGKLRGDGESSEKRRTDQNIQQGRHNRSNDGKFSDSVGGNGLTRPSSIFKALPIKLSEVERSTDDGDGDGGGMNEFDEFGDRITAASETVSEVEMEEYGFPNSLLLEQKDWSGGVSTTIGTDGTVGHEDENGRLGLRRGKNGGCITKSDRKAVDGGRGFGEEIRMMDMCVLRNLCTEEREYVISQTDEGVGLGIRLSGDMRGRGDRDVATGARLFMDAAATIGAETLGWPVVESDYSVAEGASHSASECRTLLYAAGML